MYQRQHPLSATRVFAGAAAALLVFGVVGCANNAELAAPERDGYGVITAAQSGVDIMQLKVGDCLDSKPGAAASATASVVPCKDPHIAEIFAELDVPASADPGAKTYQDDLLKQCVDQFEPFVGLSYDESKLEAWAIVPSSESFQNDDRKAYCLIADTEGDSSGTLKDAQA